VRVSEPRRAYRYYDYIMAAFVCALLCSNIIGTSKVAQVTIGDTPIRFGAGILFFPLSYMFGDVLTEVYGYARSRRVVWAGFASLAFASLMSWVVIHLTPADGWGGQKMVEEAFGSTARIAMSSLLAFFCGEFANSYVLAKMKILTRGRWLWTRTIGSTIVGEACDSLVFYPLAFWGTWAPELVITVMITNYCLKVGWEVLATPLTYRVVAVLKQAENEDYYDRDTRFTPFSVKV
jgi:uncharacterized integral membrane protein (TIGR00697 family)